MFWWRLFQKNWLIWSCICFGIFQDGDVTKSNVLIVGCPWIFINVFYKCSLQFIRILLSILYICAHSYFQELIKYLWIIIISSIDEVYSLLDKELYSLLSINDFKFANAVSELCWLLLSSAAFILKFYPENLVQFAIFSYGNYRNSLPNFSEKNHWEVNTVKKFNKAWLILLN
jgi:hypothetical protein